MLMPAASASPLPAALTNGSAAASTVNSASAIQQQQQQLSSSPPMSMPMATVASMQPCISVAAMLPAAAVLQPAQPAHHGQKDTTWTKLFVGGLPYHTTDKSLREHFEVYGDIEEAVVITDRQTGKSRGYGFVIMATKDAAERACKEPNPIIDGRKANVNLAILGAKPRGNSIQDFSGLPLATLQRFPTLIPGQYGLPAASPSAAGNPYLQSMYAAAAAASPYATLSPSAAAAAGLFPLASLGSAQNPFNTGNSLLDAYASQYAALAGYAAANGSMNGVTQADMTAMQQASYLAQAGYAYALPAAMQPAYAAGPTTAAGQQAAAAADGRLQ